MKRSVGLTCITCIRFEFSFEEQSFFLFLLDRRPRVFFLSCVRWLRNRNLTRYISKPKVAEVERKRKEAILKLAGSRSSSSKALFPCSVYIFPSN